MNEDVKDYLLDLKKQRKKLKDEIEKMLTLVEKNVKNIPIRNEVFEKINIYKIEIINVDKKIKFVEGIKKGLSRWVI